jgi:hypothetical protein
MGSSAKITDEGINQTMIREQRATYTPEETEVVLAYVNEAKAAGVPLATAYIKAADELQRPVGSVSNHYGRLNRKMKNGEIGDGIRRTPKQLSESEQIVLKLKSLKRERQRSIEKSDMYKEKYDDLSAEHDGLKKKYQTLHTDHQKLLETIKDALGEDE